MLSPSADFNYPFPYKFPKNIESCKVSIEFFLHSKDKVYLFAEKKIISKSINPEKKNEELDKIQTLF